MPFISPSLQIDLLQAQLGVVPVVAQAGTALFPLIVLAITSTIGLLLKPRELLRVFRQKPWIPALLVALAVGSWWLIDWLTRAPTTSAHLASSAASTPANGTRTDWAKVALALIEQEAAAKSRPSVTIASPAVTTPVSTSTQPAQVARSFRGDVRRSGHLGGTGPRGLTPGWSYFAQDEANAMCLSSPPPI